MTGAKIDYLSELLKIHFLRPETALWRTLDCELFFQETANFSMHHGLELGCGDGTLSFILAGGRILNWDSFLENKRPAEFNEGVDIHDCEPTLNMSVDDSQLRLSYDLAVDLKPALINKALRFSKLYKSGLAQDLNEKLSINRKFPFIFSNILYWLQDVSAMFQQIHSLLEENGKAYLFLPNANFKTRNWLYYSAPHAPPRAHLNFFDRGYNGLIHHCYESTKWESLMKSAGLKVEKRVTYMSSEVSDIWNIGTRPIAPLLISMANRLTDADRSKVTEEWVEYFRSFFTPLINEELTLAARDEADGMFHFFVVGK